jgi:ribosome-associated protein
METRPEISKTQRKREMHALQDLGEILVELPADHLRQVDLPEHLRDAILEARKITRWGARRRQLQYIGRLMREVDVTAIRPQLERWSRASAQEAARSRRVEQWRDRLLNEESALTELLAHFPQADAQHLRTLTRNAKQEAAHDKPPRSARALFRVLRELLQSEGGEASAKANSALKEGHG